MINDDDPINKTKIILPKRRMDLLSRPRLLEILYDRLDRKLIIISAAAGYGKTSLLIDLAYHSELQFCWLALDALDRDPQRFIAGIIASLGERFTGFGKRSQSLLSSMTDLDDGMERLLVTLINEIYDDIHEHFVLVLDDFHMLDEATPVLNFVNRFIQLVGEHCHVMLASRTLPGLRDIPLFVAREEVGGLDFSDLSFRPDEFQALLAQNRQVHLTDEDAQSLVNDTEGWVTGLQFTDLSPSVTGEGAQPFRTPQRVGVTVFDYLGQQVLAQQPPELQAFMLRTSMLEEFDAKLCKAVLGPLYEEAPDWSRLIDLITQKNLFTQPVGPSGRWLRYHHLFRDYLRQRFREGCPEEVEPILRRLAEYHESVGEWEKAYQLYTQFGDTDTVAALIERAGIPMYQRAMLTLESWLKALPPSAVNRRAGLLSLSGNIELMKGNSSESLRLFDRAIGLYGEHKQQEGLALALVRRGGAYLNLGRYDELIRDANQVMESTDSRDDMQWIHADALRLYGLCLFRLGRTQKAVTYFQQALDIYVRVHDTASTPLLLMETGMAQSTMGNFWEAKASYEKALKIWKDSGNLTSQASLLNNYGVLHQQLGEYEEAAHALEEGLLCAQQSGYRRMEALISLSLGDLYSEVEDIEIASQNYRQAGDLIEQLGEPFLHNYLALMLANLALLRGDAAETQRKIGIAAAMMQDSRSNFENGMLQLLKGRLELQNGKLPKAVLALKEARRLFEKDGRDTERIWATVWLGAAEYESGEHSAARDDMRAAVPNANQINHAAIVAARQARNWLGSLRKDHELRPHLRGLFDKADRLETKFPPMRRQLRRLAHTIELPTPSLIIHAFGASQVWVNGTAVSGKEWQTQAVRELFFLFLGANRPLTRDQVFERLWPGLEEPSRLKMRFKNDLYRLRRAVGQDTILFNGETYCFDASIDHEYDAEAFEAFLRKARSTSRTSDQIHFYERAVNLVQGKYLEDINASWVIAEQERMHLAFLSAVQALTELYQKEGQTPKAVEICERALALDKTAEPIYRALMRIFGRLADKASVVHIYKRCEKHMQEILQIKPSDETTELYRELTS